MGLALDESKSNDETVTVDTLIFLVNKELMERCGNIKVDFMDAGYRSGFSVSSTYPLSSGGSCSTSSCGSGKSCGC